MAITKTEERIPARMPHDVYERIAEAAKSIGATLNQFIVQSALEKANDIIERERTLNLSTQAAKTVFDLLENPPQPVGQLKKALQQRNNLVHYGFVSLPGQDMPLFLPLKTLRASLKVK